MMLTRRIWLTLLPVVALWSMGLGGATPEDRVDLQKREMLNAMDQIHCDTWFQRWFASDAVDPVTRSHDRFRQMLRKSSEMELAARAILADPGVSTDKKIMAIRMMQCLPVDRYLAFVRFLLVQTSSGHYPVSLLADVLYPGDWWGTGVVLFHRDPDLEAVLEDIERASVGDKRVTETLSAIRDGSYVAYLGYLLEPGARALPVSCDE